MKNRIKNFIVDKSLFLFQDKLILAISGGADSVFLMHFLLENGYNFELAHCNFNLRGYESDDDERFIKELAKKYKLTLHIKHFDTKNYASKNRISLQMAARDLRYKWFNDLLISEDAKYIVIAHHIDDSVETFFINILRGSGLKGLLGIKEKNKRIVRPLMSVTKNEIINYLQNRGFLYRNDSSNSSLKYLRNKIRNIILPLLIEINPSIKKTLSNEMKILEGVSEVYHLQIDKVRKDIMQIEDNIVKVKILDLLALKPLHIYLYELFSPYGFSDFLSISDSLEGQSGKCFFSSTHQLLINRDFVIISNFRIVKDILFTIQELTQSIIKPINLNFLLSDSVKWNDDSNYAYLDFDKLHFPLTLRTWQTGDKFMPLGMTKFKKLSDYFIDNKFSVLEKKSQWLLCSESDIVWIVGHRIDNRYKLHTKTKKVYIAQHLK